MASELRVDKIVPTDGVPTGGGGGIVQVVHETRTTSFTTTNTAYVDFMSVTITPKFNTSKMLVRYGLSAGTDNDNMHVYSSMFRNDTQIATPTDTGSRTDSFSVHNTMDQSMTYGGGEHLDSPATTSAVTYKIQVKLSDASNSAQFRNQQINNGVGQSRLVAMEVSA